MNCNDAVEAWIASVETGNGMTDEQREHLRSCARCRELLDSAKHFQTMLEQTPPREPKLDSGAVEDAVRSEHAKSTVARVAMVIAAFAAFGLLLGWLRSALALPIAGFELAAIVLAVLVLGLGPIVVLYFVARSIARRQKKQLYRRLDPRRWWLGVCLGLEEATAIDRGWFRLGFAMLTITGSGVGVLLYIVLALAMPVHPADREYLWRFQAKRLLARMRSH